MLYEKEYQKLLELNKQNKIDYKNDDGLTEKEFLDAYNPGDYQRPSLTVDILVFTIESDELKLLLIKRKNHPYINSWAIPGGFVDINESSENAAKRELEEETGLRNIYMEQLYTWSGVDRDPRMRVVSTSYIALVDKNKLHPVAGDDAAEVAWFSVNKQFSKTDADGTIYYDLILKNEELDLSMESMVFNVPKENGVITNYETKIAQTSQEKLAFDHVDIINMAIDRLKNKIEYTPIAFNLVGEYFTLPALQKVYEIILGKKLYKTNFRNKVEQMVNETEKYIDTNHRPAKLYKYNKLWNIFK